MNPRFIEQRVREALSDTRVVLITGPRQAGKTTLAEKLAHSEMPFLTLDDQTTLDTARADPVGFVRGLDRAVIDEIQRAPEVLLAIKRPGSHRTARPSGPFSRHSYWPSFSSSPPGTTSR